MIDLVPVTPVIGTEVRNVDLSVPLPPRDLDRIYEAWIDTTLLLFRGQSLSPAQQVAFARQLGPVVSYTRDQFNESERPEVLVLSNLTRDGRPIGSPVSGRVWHTDGHYLDDPPAGSILHAIEVPTQGGDTWFANMVAAYDALPAATRAAIDDLEIVISRVQSRPYNYPDRPPPSETERRLWVDVTQPMVRRHEVSGRRAIYAGGNVPWRVIGMPDAEGAALVTFVQEAAILPEHTYRHQWRPGDVLLWDNRSAMHRATPYGPTERRLLHRVTIGPRCAGSGCPSRDPRGDRNIRRGLLCAEERGKV